MQPQGLWPPGESWPRRPGADLETRLDVARSLGAVGGLLNTTGDSEGALRTYAEQRELASALEAESPTEPVQFVLAQSFIGSSQVLRLGAEVGGGDGGQLERAVAILRKLAENNSGATEQAAIRVGWEP